MPIRSRWVGHCVVFRAADTAVGGGVACETVGSAVRYWHPAHEAIRSWLEFSLLSEYGNMFSFLHIHSPIPMVGQSFAVKETLDVWHLRFFVISEVMHFHIFTLQIGCFRKPAVVTPSSVLPICLSCPWLHRYPPQSQHTWPPRATRDDRCTCATPGFQSVPAKTWHFACLVC